MQSTLSSAMHAFTVCALMLAPAPALAAEPPYTVTEDDKQVTISTPHLEAVIRKEGYVTGTAGGSFLDKKTGFRDAGYGLDIVDWIMEPGKDDAYRDQLPDHMVYQYGNSYHGDRAKRSIEGPQICTKAKRINVEVIRGKDFVAVRNTFRYTLAAPGHKPGSLWTQVMVFPADTRYFISMDRIDAVNDSEAMFLRIDMPGHIKHDKGNTFSEIYLSYPTSPADGEAGQAAVTRPGSINGVGEGVVIPSSAFFGDFPPDGAFNYRRDTVAAVTGVPQRFIRAYRLFERAAEQPDAGDAGQKRVVAGRSGPWLAGMTLDPSVVHEAWCHQRGYVCMIEEFGGRPIRGGQSFSAAFIVGYFDSIEQMHAVYDQHKGHTGLVADDNGWRLTKD